MESKVMEGKLKHLEFIQSIITRMAANSFLLKGWGVTIVSALFAISLGRTKEYLLIAYLPLISFWVLDGYYLHQERLFRSLYRIVSKKEEQDISFSMNTSVIKDKGSWAGTIISKTLSWFYLPILLVVTILYLFN